MRRWLLALLMASTAISLASDSCPNAPGVDFDRIREDLRARQRDNDARYAAMAAYEAKAAELAREREKDQIELAAKLRAFKYEMDKLTYDPFDVMLATVVVISAFASVIILLYAIAAVLASLLFKVRSPEHLICTFALCSLFLRAIVASVDE
jgi:hypothetical protein